MVMRHGVYALPGILFVCFSNNRRSDFYMLPQITLIDGYAECRWSDNHFSPVLHGIGEPAAAVGIHGYRYRLRRTADNGRGAWVPTTRCEINQQQHGKKRKSVFLFHFYRDDSY